MSKLFKTHFPYCISQTKNGYALVNRDYKPLGFLTQQWVNYDEFPVEFDFKSIPEATLKKLSWEGSSEFPVYLYNDGCAPWLSKAHEKAYLAKLSLIGNINIR